MTRIFKLMLLAGAMTIAQSAIAADVHVLNWKGYGADEPWAVAAFEKATGNKVVNDFFNSEQEMLTKLRTNPGLYDVVMINAAFNDQATAEGLIQPIDTYEDRQLRGTSARRRPSRRCSTTTARCSAFPGSGA